MIQENMQTANHMFEQSAAGFARAEDSARQSWKKGPASPVIWQNEVHVWRANLDVPWSWSFDQALSQEDRDRASRFRFEGDRQHFCVARASLRLILGRYLKTKPSGLQIDVGEYGKPYLAGTAATYGVRFNLTHSNRLALIAITREREVGVDVEFMRPDFVNDDVAEHFFSRAEAEQFAAVAPEFRTQSFFNCWTRKEAYIKARGEGLSCPLDQFDVSLAPNTPATLLNSRLDRAEVSRWSFQDLFPEDGYAATLAVEGAFTRLVLWDFNQV